MEDRTNTQCPNCKEGVLLERSIQDDWDGKLTCGKCHRRVNRWNNVEEKQDEC